MITNNSPRLNSSLTKRVIELQDKGYDTDFYMTNDRHVLCAQNDHDFPAEEVAITVVDQAYDQLSHSYKYVHAIDTCNGDKGVLIADAIFTNV